MSLLTSQMTSKMSTAYSGLSALIQAATTQLGDLSEEPTSAINTPEGTPTLLSNPTTPTIDGAHLDLNRTSSWHQGNSDVATITPHLISIENGSSGNPIKLFFPEVLMRLLADPSNEDIVTFLPDGKYFAIRRLIFSNELLYKHFQLTSFEEFLQESRGWGFSRVNGNITADCDRTSSNINDGNCNTSSNNDRSTGKGDIYVFRHPHFEKNRPVDMDKINFRNKDTMNGVSGKNYFIDGKSKHRTLLENTKTEVNASKRHLCPSHSGELGDNRQRLKLDSESLRDNIDPFPMSVSSSEPPSQQLRRQSSSELRGVAEAITASKLHFANTREARKENDDSSKDVLMIYDTDKAKYPHGGLDESQPGHERRHSTASSLVDGGVETATQNIVTDAIEALLFDERHTRETYHRHEKELSVSSLPGVVPISKQLFSSGEGDNATSFANEKIQRGEANSTMKKQSILTRKETKIKKSPSESAPPSPLMTHSTMSSPEYRSRNNDNLPSSSSQCSSKSRLRVIVPNDDCRKEHRRGSTYDSMVVSPARMEAAAALVSQSRNRNDDF
mmetsp:Transcript_710/g.1515  ORF Transcript_710/g.1515 Transcript_710/m.1515 type:complete len:559 (-) Transcript_710:842-2518(-)